MSLGCLFCKSSLRLVWLAEWALWIVGKSHVHDPNVCDRNKLHVHLLSLLFSGILSIQERGFLTGAFSFYLSYIVLIIFVFQICFFCQKSTSNSIFIKLVSLLYMQTWTVWCFKKAFILNFAIPFGPELPNDV